MARAHARMPTADVYPAVINRAHSRVWQWFGRRQRRGAPRSSSQSMMAPGSSDASEPRRLAGVSAACDGARRLAAGGVVGAPVLTDSDGVDGAGDFAASGGLAGAGALSASDVVARGGNF